MSKTQVAAAIAQRVKTAQVIGLGSGSTAELAVKEIGRRIEQEGLKVSGLATSFAIAKIAAEVGISVLHPASAPALDWAFDGADEIDPEFNLIKGAGAAMFSEKLIARRAGGRLVIIATEEKLVSKLGSKFPIPVEVVPQATQLVEQELKKLGAKSVTLRVGSGKYGPLVTEQGNFILDAQFQDSHPVKLEAELKQITGVLETGLFVGLAEEILLAGADGVYSLKPGERKKLN